MMQSEEFEYPEAENLSPPKPTAADSMDSVDYMAMLKKYERIAVEMEHDAAKCANHPWICAEMRELAGNMASMAELGGQ